VSTVDLIREHVKRISASRSVPFHIACYLVPLPEWKEIALEGADETQAV